MDLYLVKATTNDYDTFDQAVVYADDPEDACMLVRGTIDWVNRSPFADLAPPGVWYALDPGADLVATVVKVERGPVLGHGLRG
jgi:hypothetical protein